MTASSTSEPTTPTGSLDDARVEAFAAELLGTYTAGMVTLMLDLAHRTGLLEALAAGPGTSTTLAARAGLQERYVRECLGALVTAEVVTYDPADTSYRLPAEHARCLSGPGAENLAPLAQIVSLLATHVGGVTRAFREGGGVPYREFRPDFTDVMDGISRGLFDTHLVDTLLPMAGDVVARLTSSARVADVGCGTGHSTNLLARAFPRSSFVGYDLGDDAVARGRAEAAAWGLDNVRFETLDVARLPPAPPFEVVFAFDAIHDQADPAGVLRRIAAALVPGGVFVMLDVRAASALEDNIGDPLAPLLYGISTLHCMTVSLAEGGAGLGTVWGEQIARRMLTDAGFVGTEVHEVPDDPLDLLYVCRRPGA